MQIDNLHEMLNPFAGINKTNIMYLLSAFVQTGKGYTGGNTIEFGKG